MKNLVEVVNKTPIEIALQIDEDGFTTARRLYTWLEMDSSHYSRWCKKYILENPFAEYGVDYSPLEASKGRGNFADDYKISSDLAKKLSMQQRTERGEQARNYFIGCEQALVRLAEQLQDKIRQIRSFCNGYSLLSRSIVSSIALLIKPVALSPILAACS